MRAMPYSLLWVFVLSCGGNKDADGTTDADADTDVDADTDTDTDADADATPVGRVRFANIGADLPNVSVYSDAGTPVLTNVEPFSASRWNTVTPGSKEYAVGPSDGGFADAWTTTTTLVEQDRRYSIVVYGPTDAVGALSFEEDPTPLNKNRALYSLFHGAVGIDAVDFIDVTEGTSLAKGVTYGTAPPQVERAAGAWDIGVDLDRDGKADITFTIADLGDRITVPLYFAVDGNELVLMGQAPTGAARVQRAPLPKDKKTPTPTGSTAQTGDTGS